VAISGEQLVQRGYETQESFNRMVPNVVIHGSSGFFARQEGGFHMRAIGNVAILYDGIAHPETFGILTSNITEVDHVEVLRGPQGTLFGKEAMGGAIQYVTVKPAKTLGARGKISAGAYNRFDVQAIVDVPITETLLTKFSLGKFSRDGYVRSNSTGIVLGDQSDTVVEADILWNATDKLSWRNVLSRAHNTNNGNPSHNYVVNTGIAGAFNPCAATNPPGRTSPDLSCVYNAIGLTIPQSNTYGAAGKYVTDSSYAAGHLYTTIDGIKSSAIYDFNETLVGKILVGYRRVKNWDYTDFDATQYNMYEGKNYNEQDEGTAEIQLQFTGERLSGTSGIYGYLDYGRVHRMRWAQNELKFAVNPANNAAAIAWLQTRVNPVTGNTYIPNTPAGALAARNAADGPIPGNGNVDSLQWNYSKGQAFFSEWTYKVTDKLSATAGVRINKDHIYIRDFTPKFALPVRCCEPVPSVANNGAPPLQTIESDFDNTSPKFSVQYQWNPDLMTYLSYSEGFNRGGATVTRATPTVPSQLIPVNPETVQNTELGVRSDWLGGRLRFNATYFFAKQLDIKVVQDLGGISVLRNAGEAESKGLEIDGYWAITDALMLNYALGTNDAKLTSLLPGVSRINFSVGQVLNFAPRRSASGGLAYRLPLASGAALTLRGDYGWQSEQWTTNDLTNRVLLPASGLMNARISYAAPDDKYELALSGTNVLGKFYRINGYLIPGVYNDIGTAGRPREWALTLSTRF
jgi:iron complex outermembrane receptor protein